MSTAGSIRSPMRNPFGVVVPIRTFALGNTRLSSALDDAARTALAVRLADRVIAAAGTAPVVVVSSAPEVVAWAGTHGAQVIADPGSLNAAATAGVAALAASRCQRAVIAHADLPLVRTFAAVAHDAGRPIVTLVPCHRDDGTPVCSVPIHASFAFAYGPDSFRRHIAAATRGGLAVRVVRDPTLAFDVDTVDDLTELTRREALLLSPDRA